MNFAPLNTTWFALIGLLWAGYLFLEGFDFGVGVVGPLISRDDTDRRICLNAVGPVWDGNEVWLIVAGGATFAAFPGWYAALFSGFYLVLFLVLLALIVRGVSFEFRNKLTRPGWRRTWDVANFAGNLVPAIVWGAAFTDFAHGVPLSAKGYSGGLLGAVHPIAIFGGLASLALFMFHGSLFLSLKTDGDLMARARAAARVTGAGATALVGGLVAWLVVAGRPPVPGELPGWVPLAIGLASVVAVAVAVVLTSVGRDGWAFVATGTSIVVGVGAIFARMFPAVLPASNPGANGGLLIGTAASLHNTLSVMTIVAAIFTPFVLAYQGWTYWVFRQRLVRPAGDDGPMGIGSVLGGPRAGGPGGGLGARSAGGSGGGLRAASRAVAPGAEGG